jgi:hypothetical protein
MSTRPPDARPVAASTPAPAAELEHGQASRRRLRRLFLEGFTAADVAEPLVSFDAERPAAEVRRVLEARGFDLVGVRRDGLVRGYAVREELRSGACGDHLHPFGPDDLVASTASLQEVIRSLDVNLRCFVTQLDEVSAIVTLDDLEKPPVRMFLFGMLTLFEMIATRRIDEGFPGDGWVSLVAPGRLEKARALQEERARRGHPAGLLDCLQLSDRGQLLLELPGFQERLRSLGLESRKSSLRALKELEALRNHLAHAQDIVPESWRRIALFSQRLDALLEAL